jgi:hypothetical protein
VYFTHLVLYVGGSVFFVFVFVFRQGWPQTPVLKPSSCLSLLSAGTIYVPPYPVGSVLLGKCTQLGNYLRPPHISLMSSGGQPLETLLCTLSLAQNVAWV